MVTIRNPFTSDTSYSVEEQNKIREERTNFNDLIQNYHKRVLELKEKGKLTPESANEILVLNDTTYKWLTDNPTADLLKILSQKDAYKQRADTIIETDKPKAQFISYYTGIPYIADTLYNQRTIDDARKGILIKEARDAEAWFKTNGATANKIQLDTYLAGSEARLLDGLTDIKVREAIRTAVANIKAASAEKLRYIFGSLKKNEKKLEESEFRLSTVTGTTWSIATSIFVWSVVFVVCAFSGSLAANTVIHRPAVYRLLYFIWGAIPLFVVPIFIYFIFQRVKSGPLHLYTMIPIVSSTADYENSLGFFERLLRSAVVYYPDEHIDTLAAAFQKTLESYKQ
jgi:ABC-type sugar transport system permease subunit